MSEGLRQAPATTHQVSYRCEDRCLTARVTGTLESIDALIAMFGGFAEELLRQKPTALLVLDETVSIMPTDAEYQELAGHMQGSGFDQVRTAYVDVRGESLARIELGELIAREQGYQLRVFDNEKLARIWLRYGVD